MISERRYREIAGIFIFLAGLMLLLSLCTYSATDMEMLRTNRPVHNLVGPLGAWIGNIARIAFGYPSSIIAVILFFSGWHFIKKGDPALYLERVFSLSFCMITLSALFALIEPVAVPQNAGGYVGLYLYRFFHGISGTVGAVLIISILNLAGLVLMGVFSVLSLVNAAGEKRPLMALRKLLSRVISIGTARTVPLNTISEGLVGKKAKPPWIEKKRVTVYRGRVYSAGDGTPGAARRLLEYRDSFSPQEPEADYRDAHSLPDDRYEESPGQDDYLPDEYAMDPAVETATEPHYDEFSYPQETDGSPVSEALEELVNPGVVNTNRFRISLEDDERDSGISNLETAGPIHGRAMAEQDSPAVTEDIPGKKPGSRPVDKTAGTDRQQTFEFGLPELDGPPVGAKLFDEIAINRDYIIPTAFLQSTLDGDAESWKSEIVKNSELLVNTLKEFGIESKIVNVNRGPVITLYEMQIAPGIKVNRIVSLADDIAMALSGSRVRIVAPIPGKSAIGVEVPNRKREMVTLGDLMNSKEYHSQTGYLKVALGQDILGKPVMLDLKKLPHLLIAGATGSGKSVCVNSIITSLVYNYDPNYVRFIMVDPKMVELQLYNGIPHLLTPVITEAHVAPKALKWAMIEMERRYRLLSELRTRDIERYNQKITGYGDRYEHLPYIVIIMDEMADLMMVASKEIEGFVTRIAQKARAVGIHLVLATQRPSVDVITGVIKANFPARIAFQVAQKTDSRTIIDQNGAEKLLGKGDMLYQSPLSSFPARIQGTYVSEDEVMAIVQHLRKLGVPSYIDIDEAIFEEDLDDDETGDDELFVEALKIVEETKKASASYLQRRLSIGYNRAARIIELMEERGYVGPQQGSKPREVFI